DFRTLSPPCRISVIFGKWADKVPTVALKRDGERIARNTADCNGLFFVGEPAVEASCTLQAQSSSCFQRSSVRQPRGCPRRLQPARPCQKAKAVERAVQTRPVCLVQGKRLARLPGAKKREAATARNRFMIMFLANRIHRNRSRAYHARHARIELSPRDLLEHDKQSDSS